jgi:uncharacterized RDD family membrane protein YckC
MAYGMQPPRDPTEVMGRRIVAYIIDFFLFAGVLIAIMAATKDHAYTGAPSGACQTLRDGGFNGLCLQFGHRVYTWKGGQAAIGYLLAALLGTVNLVVLQGMTGASIGKQIMGLRVVNAQGQPCGIGRAFLRSLLLIVDNFFCFVVGLLTAALTHPHRRVGDMAAGTYVVALADVGRPLQVGVPAPYPAGYPQGGPAGWAPPGAQPGAGWDAPPAPPAWGGPAAPPPPSWGAPPPAAPPTWGATPPVAAPDPQQIPSTWGAPAAPPPVPTPAPPLPPVDRTGWGAPPSPWTTRAPGAEPAPPPPPPPPAPAPAPPPPAADPAAPAPPDAPVEGESWWSKAVSDDDEAEK